MRSGGLLDAEVGCVSPGSPSFDRNVVSETPRGVLSGVGYGFRLGLQWDGVEFSSSDSSSLEESAGASTRCWVST